MLVLKAAELSSESLYLAPFIHLPVGG